MKKIISLALIAVMTVGCSKRTNTYVLEKETTYIVDGCEYISGGYGVLTHKGNCKYCAERRKQELREVLEQLKAQ